MTSTPHKGLTSRQLSALTTRHPSQHCISIDGCVDYLLSPTSINHSKHQRLKSDQSIGTSLLERHSKLKARKAQLRQQSKSRELREMLKVPITPSKSLRKLRHKSQEEIKLFVDSIPRKIFHLDEDVKVAVKKSKADWGRPQDAIDIPDVSVLREVMTRTVPVRVVEEVNLKEMSIVEKTEYFLKKKSERIGEAEKEKVRDMLQECTFRPDTRKPEVKESKHRKSMTSLVGSGSKVVSKKGKKVIRKKKNVDIRPPPPSGKVKRAPARKSETSKPFLSPSYSQLSPVKKIYSDERLSINNVISRSKEMVCYNAFSTRSEAN